MLLNPPKMIKCPSIVQQTDSPLDIHKLCRFVPNQSDTDAFFEISIISVVLNTSL